MDRPTTIDKLLSRARTNIERLAPPEALVAQQAGDLIVDIRPLEQRRRDGTIAGAVVVDRNVLEWRLAPTSKWRLPEASDHQVILLCNQGYQSSLAAYTMCQMGLAGTADVIGGFEAWLAGGLPIVQEAAQPSTDA